MFFDDIIHGTQYYRSPTPLPEEWEGDIANLENFNLDVMQIRINWRQNEIREGEYNFSDVDRLMELAEKYNGGGHACAAGATVYSKKEMKQLLAEADALLKEYKEKNTGWL
jgi:beta-galactosidase GanA